MATLQQQIARLSIQLQARILQLVGDGHAAELATRTQNLSPDLFEIIKDLPLHELCQHATYQRINRYWKPPTILQLTRIDRHHSRKSFFQNARFYGNIEDIVVWIDRLPQEFRVSVRKIYAFATPQTMRLPGLQFSGMGIPGERGELGVEKFLGAYSLPETFHFEEKGLFGAFSYRLEGFGSEDEMLEKMYPEVAPQGPIWKARMEKFRMAVLDSAFIVPAKWWLAVDEGDDDEW